MTHPFILNAQIASSMKEQYIDTQIGKIAIYIKEVKNTTPILFLHGVYFDHHLWDYYTSNIQQQTTIAIDMPLHGKSNLIDKNNWTLEDGASMLLEIMDSLAIDSCIAIGHSWGSMTIIRAAAKQPERFQKIGLCNMPFEAPNKRMIRQFKAQHWILPFRKFYTKQVAKALYGKQTLSENPALLEHLGQSMGLLLNKAIKQTDYAVIIHATDQTDRLKSLQIPTFALKGKEDYVPTPPQNISTTVVAGGHVSPLEVPEQVWEWMQLHFLD